MMLGDVFKAVDALSPDELRKLRSYIEQREQRLELEAGTLDVNALLRGLQALRAGLSDAEFHEIERAMNEEYIEPLDDDA